MTIVEFLLARIAEDEKAAREGVEDYAWAEESADLDAAALLWQARRALAECEAKRRVVEAWEWADERDNEAAEFYRAQGLVIALHSLASVYADHPEFRDEWRSAE